MRRLMFVFNPEADRGDAARIAPRLRALLEEMAAEIEGETFELTWINTDEPRHATALAADAAQGGFDAVIAVGGDGTVHEVANGLMQIDAGERPLMGVIPAGSGNDFAHNFGLPETEIEAARCTLGMVTRPVDVMHVDDGNGRQEYWINTLGIGFSGAVNITTRRYSRWRGFAIYLIAVLETVFFKPAALHARIGFDGAAPSDYDVAMISLCNGPREGGGFPVAPTARMDDGLLSYVIMRKMSRLRILRFLPVVLGANHLKHTRYFTAGTATSFEIETDSAMAIHTDGEVFGPWEADVRHLAGQVFPAAIQVLCSC